MLFENNYVKMWLRNVAALLHPSERYNHNDIFHQQSVLFRASQSVIQHRFVHHITDTPRKFHYRMAVFLPYGPEIVKQLLGEKLNSYFRRNYVKMIKIIRIVLKLVYDIH